MPRDLNRKSGSIFWGRRGLVPPSDLAIAAYARHVLYSDSSRQNWHVPVPNCNIVTVPSAAEVFGAERCIAEAGLCTGAAIFHQHYWSIRSWSFNYVVTKVEIAANPGVEPCRRAVVLLPAFVNVRGPKCRAH